jgi:hypothetical protein
MGKPIVKLLRSLDPHKLSVKECMTLGSIMSGKEQEFVGLKEAVMSRKHFLSEKD